MHKQNGMIITALMIALGTSSAAQAKIIKNNTPKNPLLKKADVLLVGPGGDTQIFYLSSEGNIVVQACGSDYEPFTSKENCKGNKVDIPREDFKRTLKSILKISKADRLAPLSAEEAKNYSPEKALLHDKLVLKKEALLKKLNDIQNFIDLGGGAKAQKDKEKVQALINALERSENFTNNNSVDKVNALVDDIVNKITSGGTPIVVADGKDKNNAIYTLLKKFSSASKYTECGTNEALKNPAKYNEDEEIDPTTNERATWFKNIFISEAIAKGSPKKGGTSSNNIALRIQNCASNPDSTKTGKNGTVWNLVARKKIPNEYGYQEVWRDSKTGKVWGTQVHPKNSDGYTNIIQRSKVLRLKGGKLQDNGICQSFEGINSVLGIKEIEFHLPTLEEFEDGDSNGLGTANEEGNHSKYWVSTGGEHLGSDLYTAKIWSMSGNYHDTSFYSDDYANVRCVGDDK